VSGRRAGLLLGLCGAALLRISLFSDLYLRYVKAGLRPLLILGGLLLVVLAVLSVVLDGGPGQGHDSRDEHDDDGGHAHHPGGRLAWALAGPALLLLLFAPPSLGAFTVARDGSGEIARQVHFAPLPASGVLKLTLSDFSSRVVWDTKDSLRGRTVQLMGFATPLGDGSWKLSRVLVTCCAADARVVTVHVHGLRAPAADAWVTVTGTWRTTESQPALDGTAVAAIPAPADPYRDSAPR
jgi:uncharacterized repeat protein (TIGR03943 family)